MPGFFTKQPLYTSVKPLSPFGSDRRITVTTLPINTVGKGEKGGAGVRKTLQLSGSAALPGLYQTAALHERLSLCVASGLITSIAVPPYTPCIMAGKEVRRPTTKQARRVASQAPSDHRSSRSTRSQRGSLSMDQPTQHASGARHAITQSLMGASLFGDPRVPPSPPHPPTPPDPVLRRR